MGKRFKRTELFTYVIYVFTGIFAAGLLLVSIQQAIIPFLSVSFL